MPSRVSTILLLVITLILAAAISLKVGRRWIIPDVLDRSTVLLAWSVLVASLLSALPIAVGNSFQAANDTFTYVAISEYLQKYGFGVPAALDPLQPLLSQVVLYQQLGFRMGAIFLLSSMQSIVPQGARAVEVYPSAVALGVASNVLAVYLLGRWTLGLSARASLAAPAVMALAPNSVQAAAAHGFLPQTFGTAAFYWALALVSRMPDEWRSSKWLVACVGVSWAFLASVYSELLPVLGLVIALSSLLGLVHARFGGAPGPNVRALAGAAPIFVLAANYELVRAARAIPTQLGAVVGWDVRWPALDFAAFAVGAFPGSAEIALFPSNRAVWLLTVGLVALGVVGLLSSLREAPLRHAVGAVVVLLAMAAYFAFIARNPWTGNLGNSWSLYKVLGWLYPMILVLEVSGLSALCTRIRRVSVTAQVMLIASVVVVSLPLQLRLAGLRADVLARLTRTEYPVASLLSLRETMLQRGYATVGVVAPESGEVWPKLLYAYFLAPLPVVSDWTGSGYMALLGNSATEVARAAGLSLSYLAVGVPPSGADWMAGTRPIQDAAVLSVSGRNGVEEEGGQSFIWLGGGPVEVEMWARKRCEATLKFGVKPGPSRPDTAERNLRVTLPSGVVRSLSFSGADVVTIDTQLAEGRQVVAVEDIDQPSVTVQPNGDTRPLLARMEFPSILNCVAVGGDGPRP